jgi:hypothetical protein
MNCDNQRTFRVSATLWRGVLRRFFLYVFNPKYVKRSIAARKGECKRCGACCHLVANKCGWLKLHGGTSSCRVYNFRVTPNCWIFPIDARDIADRNLVAPVNVPCGYSFPSDR